MNELEEGGSGPAVDAASAPTDQELTEVVISRETMWAWTAAESFGHRVTIIA